MPTRAVVHCRFSIADENCPMSERMPAHCLAIFVLVFAVLILRVRFISAQVVATAIVQTQLDPSRSAQPVAGKEASKLSAARDIFKQLCAMCHGKDGSGKASRDQFSEIPDFTNSTWHGRRSDAQLLASVLDGKGTGMPSFRGRIKDQEANALVASVRAFGPTTRNLGKGKREQLNSADFDERYLQLEREMSELQRQFRELSGRPQVDLLPQQPRSPREANDPLSAQLVKGSPTTHGLFRKHCIRCHGTDGTGSPARDGLPDIPDFTNPDWQKRRSDHKLLVSIRDGKGEEMPPFGEKIKDEQIRALIGHVRSFVQTNGNPGPSDAEKKDRHNVHRAKTIANTSRNVHLFD
jgi:mono/diheme cytochrome c family protein